MERNETAKAVFLMSRTVERPLAEACFYLYIKTGSFHGHLIMISAFGRMAQVRACAGGDYIPRF